ncbi:MAG: cytochrome c, partial [Acidobacteria bacterium]
MKRLLLSLALVCGASIRVAAQGELLSSSRSGPLPVDRTGEDVYRAACMTCHGPDGTGSPKSVVGFDVPVPDFSDCAFSTAEPDPDWHAVVHEGGSIRGLDR